ncbi:hypothetical protein C8R47DRAFT_1070423 [Mycena vitilis]|nr:hypothetical protein C8R47DRAFT_1070423 [Mycena vitilis]
MHRDSFCTSAADRDRTISSSDNESLPSPSASSTSLSSLVDRLSTLDLAPRKKPRKGQFGYVPEITASSSSSTTLESQSDSTFWEQLPGFTTPQQSPQKLRPAHLPPHLIPTPDSSDDESMSVQFFYGDGRDPDPVPGDHLKAIQQAFKENSSDQFKCDRLIDSFATNSEAETWAEALPPATVANWAALKAAFLVKWPKQTIVVKTVEQHRKRLRAEKLSKDAIGQTEMVKGVETTGQAAWANRILFLSGLAQDTSGALISSVREGMPEMMQKLLKGTFATWPAFCDAVKAIDEDEIRLALANEKRIQQTEDEVRRLRTEVRSGGSVQGSPTAPLRAAFGNFTVGRGGTPQRPPAAANHADPFAPGGQMHPNNIMRAFAAPARGGNPARGAGFRPNPQRMADLSANTAAMVHHGDTPAGRTAYQAQVANWAVMNPNKAGPDEFAPYPLTPGTLPVGSGECYTCGVRHPMNQPHPRANVPAFEQRYRGIAGYIIRTDRRDADTATAAGAAIVQHLPAGTAINFVEATNEYPAHFVFSTEHTGEQGNAEGPGASLCDKTDVVPGARAASFGESWRAPTDVHTSANMYSKSEPESILLSDVYSLERRNMAADVEAVPFTQTVQLNGPRGEGVELKGTFDDGAMVNAIDSVKFEHTAGHLGALESSPRVLRMANGTSNQSGGRWCGPVTVEGVTAPGCFELLPSGGSWEVLMGKPILQAFRASHDYVSDEVTLRVDGMETVLQNSTPPAEGTRKNKVAIAHVSDPGECESISPLTQRPVNPPKNFCALDIPLPQVPELVDEASVVQGPVLQNDFPGFAEGARTSKVAVAHASDPGECTCISPLTQRPVVNPIIFDAVDGTLPQTPVETAVCDLVEGSRILQDAVASTSDPGDGAHPSPLRPRPVSAFIIGDPDDCPLPQMSFIDEDLIEKERNTRRVVELRERRRCKERERRVRKKKRAIARDALLVFWADLAKSGQRTTSARKSCRLKMQHRNRLATRLNRWYSSPYDFGSTEENEHGSAATSEEKPQKSFPIFSTADGKVTLQEVEEEEQSPESEGLRKNKVAPAHASNPGECCGTSPLRPKEVSNSSHDVAADEFATEWTSIQSEDVDPLAKDLRKTKVADAHVSNPGEHISCSPLRPRPVETPPLCPEWINSHISQTSRRATVEDCTDEDDETAAEGLRTTNDAVASASNPGGRSIVPPLRHRQVSVRDHRPGAVDQHTEQISDIFELAETDRLDSLGPGTAQPEIRVDEDTSIFTRASEPFKPQRVKKILDCVEIGDDLTVDQQLQIRNLVAEYADVYALSIKEVKHIPGATHRLNIPDGAKFNKSIRQKRLTPPQTSYFSKALDAMLEAGVVEPIPAADVNARCERYEPG